MSKIKKIRAGNFTQISNIVFDDYRLSYKEIGLYCNMMRFPDDWEFTIRYLTDLHADKKAAVTTGLEKLIELGYIVRGGEQPRNKKGLYYCETVGNVNEETIKNYIKEQTDSDMLSEE